MTAIPEEAIWRGLPSPATVKGILALTRVDSRGKGYFLAYVGAPWCRLLTPRDFGKLNAAVDRFRYGIVPRAAERREIRCG